MTENCWGDARAAPEREIRPAAEAADAKLLAYITHWAIWRLFGTCMAMPASTLPAPVPGCMMASTASRLDW